LGGHHACREEMAPNAWRVSLFHQVVTSFHAHIAAIVLAPGFF